MPNFDASQFDGMSRIEKIQLYAAGRIPRHSSCILVNSKTFPAGVDDYAGSNELGAVSVTKGS